MGTCYWVGGMDKRLSEVVLALGRLPGLASGAHLPPGKALCWFHTNRFVCTSG